MDITFPVHPIIGIALFGFISFMMGIVFIWVLRDSIRIFKTGTMDDHREDMSGTPYHFKITRQKHPYRFYWRLFLRLTMVGVVGALFLMLTYQTGNDIWAML